MFRNLLLPMALPSVTVARDGTPQNSALRKEGTKQYMATENAGLHPMQTRKLY